MDIVILGGGAAGFLAAITCASEKETRVTLLERSSNVLAKVKISGGGRCNVTHACFEPERLVTFYPRGGKALRGPFSRFQPRDTVSWFEERGVPLKTESDGRMFPVTDSSQTIVDCLTETAKKAGVTLRCQTLVSSFKRGADGTGFDLTLAYGEHLRADRVILATGNNPQGWAWAQNLGHSIETPVPSLFTFTIGDLRLESLAGVSVPDSWLRLAGTKEEQTGPLLITHWGLSGPAVLKLSAWAARVLHEKNYQAELRVSWLGRCSHEAVMMKLRHFRKTQAKRVAVAGGPFNLPKRLWTRLVLTAGIAEEKHWTDVSNDQLLALARELQDGSYRITGQSTFKEEFVTCGGVQLKEVDFRTMESKLCPGLYFAGEILDIDGVTGGFNFQSAWTTGWIAGRSAAGSLPL